MCALPGEDVVDDSSFDLSFGGIELEDVARQMIEELSGLDAGGVAQVFVGETGSCRRQGAETSS